VIFSELAIRGAFLIQPEFVEDNRGFFSRVWCQREFAARGLNPNLVQCSISFTAEKGTLRGMHYQVPPHEEAKLIRCTMGTIFDVILDLREDSPTFQRWAHFELSASNRRILYIPPRVAHGFQTLVDDVEVFYQMTQFYAPEAARGVRFDDPVVGITWPLPITRISAKDLAWPFLEVTHHAS
jgi:dTDP-4-dehydrorhamnose 3,5-epimerase